jgi:hypothetical protein
MLGFDAVFVETDIVECELAETIKSDAFHESSRNDAVGIDVCAGDKNSEASDGRDRFECHVRLI